jgi:hypothetical protein
MNTKITFAILVAITASMFGATTLHSAIAEPAVIIIDNGCKLIDQDGNVTFLAASDTEVYTSSGNAVIKCKGETENDTGKSIKWNFDNTTFKCFTKLGLTDNWQETISTSGKVTLSCFYKTV